MPNPGVKTPVSKNKNLLNQTYTDGNKNIPPFTLWKE
jgi:hypothetical protein